MPGSVALANPVLEINNEVIDYVPNTLKFKEGFGETNVRAAAIGGGQVRSIYTEDIETKFGEVMVELYPTPQNIEIIRQWKTNGNQNVISVYGTAGGANLQRVFPQASLTENYEVHLGADTTIPLTFKTGQAS
jgi:hypothetical protein